MLSGLRLLLGQTLKPTHFVPANLAFSSAASNSDPFILEKLTGSDAGFKVKCVSLVIVEIFRDRPVSHEHPDHEKRDQQGVFDKSRLNVAFLMSI